MLCPWSKFSSYFMSNSHCENLRVLMSDDQLINFTQKSTARALFYTRNCMHIICYYFAFYIITLKYTGGEP